MRPSTGSGNNEEYFNGLSGKIFQFENHPSNGWFAWSCAARARKDPPPHDSEMSGVAVDLLERVPVAVRELDERAHPAVHGRCESGHEHKGVCHELVRSFETEVDHDYDCHDQHVDRVAGPAPDPRKMLELTASAMRVHLREPGVAEQDEQPAEHQGQDTPTCHHLDSGEQILAERDLGANCEHGLMDLSLTLPVPCPASMVGLTLCLGSTDQRSLSWVRLLPGKLFFFAPTLSLFAPPLFGLLLSGPLEIALRIELAGSLSCQLSRPLAIEILLTFDLVTLRNLDDPDGCRSHTSADRGRTVVDRSQVHENHDHCRDHERNSQGLEDSAAMRAQEVPDVAEDPAEEVTDRLARPAEHTADDREGCALHGQHHPQHERCDPHRMEVRAQADLAGVEPRLHVLGVCLDRLGNLGFHPRTVHCVVVRLRLLVRQLCLAGVVAVALLTSSFQCREQGVVLLVEACTERGSLVKGQTAPGRTVCHVRAQVQPRMP